MAELDDGPFADLQVKEVASENFDSRDEIVAWGTDKGRK